MAQSRYAEGFIRCVEGKHQEGYKAMDRATRLDPNFAAAHAQKANQLVRLGSAKEALPIARYAIELADPYDQSIRVLYWVLGRTYFVLKDYNTRSTGYRDPSISEAICGSAVHSWWPAMPLPGALKRRTKRYVNFTVGDSAGTRRSALPRSTPPNFPTTTGYGIKHCSAH
jgi:hypothetical protein